MRKQSFLILLCISVLVSSMPTMAQNCMLSFTRQLSSSFLNTIYQDAQGMIWVTTENGLNRYDGYTFESFNTNDGLASDNIINVIQGSDGKLYVGTARGLCRSTTNGFIPVYEEANNYIHQFYVTDLLKTQKGEIIAATSGGGLCKITPAGKYRDITEKLQEAKYCRSIIEDSNGNLWATTDNKYIICIYCSCICC